jgi:hypothetical protein
MSYIPNMDRSSRGKIRGKCRLCGNDLKDVEGYITLVECSECGACYNKEEYGK